MERIKEIFKMPNYKKIEKMKRKKSEKNIEFNFFDNVELFNEFDKKEKEVFEVLIILDNEFRRTHNKKPYRYCFCSPKGFISAICPFTLGFMANRFIKEINPKEYMLVCLSEKEYKESEGVDWSDTKHRFFESIETKKSMFEAIREIYNESEFKKEYSDLPKSLILDSSKLKLWKGDV